MCVCVTYRYRREVELQDAELQNEKQTTRVLREQLQSEMEQRERLEGRVMVLSADTREMEQQLEITSLACGQLQVCSTHTCTRQATHTRAHARRWAGGTHTKARASPS